MAGVLYWVVKGKVNLDIADILVSSQATVKQHLERESSANSAWKRARELPVWR